MASARMILGSVGVVSALGMASGYAWLTSSLTPQPSGGRPLSTNGAARGTSLGLHAAASRPGASASRPVRPAARPLEDARWDYDEAV